MDGLIELVFENVPDDGIGKLIRHLLRGAGKLHVTHSELGELDPTKSVEELLPLLKLGEEAASIFIRTDVNMVGDVPIFDPLVRILRFDGANEVAVVFECRRTEESFFSEFITKLSARSQRLASDIGVQKYYCGFEPATDEATRLFSNDNIGPFLMN